MTNSDLIPKYFKTFSFTFPEIQIFEKYIQWNLILAFLLSMLSKRILQIKMFVYKVLIIGLNITIQIVYIYIYIHIYTHTHTHYKPFVIHYNMFQLSRSAIIK
jgi:hypothetical protein